jgi:hypothetical protein
LALRCGATPPSINGQNIYPLKKNYLAIIGRGVWDSAWTAGIPEIDQKAVLLATVDDHFLLPGLFDLHLKPDVSKAVVLK